MANECVVYHKHLAGMDTSDGYIGISKSFEERMKQHHRDAFVRNSIYTVHEKMRMYGDDVITSKIFEGSINECFDYEEELRPRWHMGWNMAIGGGRPGSGWKPGKWMDNRLWHPKHGEEIVTKDNKLLDIARKYLKGTTTEAGNLSAILKGRMPKVYGWELANAQLVNSVSERYYQDWKHCYLTRDREVVSVYKTGLNKFLDNYGHSRKTQAVKFIITGRGDSWKNWELATEQEWLETAERVEFK